LLQGGSGVERKTFRNPKKKKGEDQGDGEGQGNVKEVLCKMGERKEGRNPNTAGEKKKNLRSGKGGDKLVSKHRRNQSG